MLKSSFLMVHPKFAWPRHQQSTPALAFLMAGAKKWPAVEVLFGWLEMGMTPQNSHFNRGNDDELVEISE